MPVRLAYLLIIQPYKSNLSRLLERELEKYRLPCIFLTNIVNDIKPRERVCLYIYIKNSLLSMHPSVPAI
jgi:hypothetical protein